MSETLILTRRDVQELLGLDECIAAVESAFRLHAEGKSLAPGVLAVRARDGGFHIKAAGLELGRHYFAAKTNANFFSNPSRHGLPAIQGVVVLCDADDGRPLAVMDSIEVTIRRTAAATAVAAKWLARKDSATATVCGCGSQGREQLRALSRVLPLARAHAYDADEAVARSYARELSDELGIEITPARDLAAALGDSDVCVTCTPSRGAFLMREHVRPGTFVAAVGADSPDKQELEPRLLAHAVLVVDVLEQCASIGELHHALEAGVLTRAAVHSELAEVLTGRRPGRQSDQEITIFDSTGTALQDVAAAALVYEKAVAKGKGVRLSLGE
ncbi:MAG TPA: ornithine cyclodeaminase family protein [Vicinamibacteria bacterium]|nr:ornithine cyclodeaminase family protein [Vicinamibacteria bacterium]